MIRDVHAVTGAFGYSGRHIAERLLRQGARVRSLTGHPDRPDPLGGRVEVRAFRFDDPARLRDDLRDVQVLFNTYWVRFDHGASTFDRAVEHSRRLLRAAAEAGVERVVHVSITNPAPDSPLPYFRGKAEVERALRESGLSHAILRPAVFFGGRDVLVNNIAWLLRRLPLFGVAPGPYGLQPIHVEDFAELAVAEAASRVDVTRDAAGPEALGFRALVEVTRRAVGSRTRIVDVPPAALLLASRLLRPILGDVALTPDEVRGLTAGLLSSREPPAGTTRFTEWAMAHGRELGREWASELARHYR